GGIVLSHYGDRFGRRRVFLWSVFVMSGATLGMGLVPSHAQWGVAASALMVLLRLVQGFCLGGELPGALTYVVETAPRFAPVVCALLAATACFTGLFFSHLPAYLSAVLGYEPRQAILAQTIGVLAHAAGILVVGRAGDRIAPRVLLRAGCVLLLVFAYPFYHA